MRRLFISLILLTAIYAMVLTSFKPWDLLIGVIISGGLLWLFRDYLFGAHRGRVSNLSRRIVAFFPFALASIREITVGIWEVILVASHLRPLTGSGIIAVPIGERTEIGVAVSTLVLTLSPGTALVTVNWDRREMLFHLLNSDDPDAFRASCQAFYDRYQRHIFP